LWDDFLIKLVKSVPMILNCRIQTYFSCLDIALNIQNALKVPTPKIWTQPKVLKFVFGSNPHRNVFHFLIFMLCPLVLFSIILTCVIQP
jgi:hypothetical protein